MTFETVREAEKTTHHMIGVLVDNKSKTHNFESTLVMNSLAKTMSFQLTRSPFLVRLLKMLLTSSRVGYQLFYFNRSLTICPR